MNLPPITRHTSLKTDHRGFCYRFLQINSFPAQKLIPAVFGKIEDARPSLKTRSTPPHKQRITWIAWITSKQLAKGIKTFFFNGKLIHHVKRNHTLALACMTDSWLTQVLACMKGIRSRENSWDGLVDCGYYSEIKLGSYRPGHSLENEPLQVFPISKLHSFLIYNYGALTLRVLFKARYHEMSRPSWVWSNGATWHSDQGMRHPLPDAEESHFEINKSLDWWLENNFKL